MSVRKLALGPQIPLHKSLIPIHKSRTRQFGQSVLGPTGLGPPVQRVLDRVVLLLALARIGGALPLLPLDGSADPDLLFRYIITCTFAVLGGWLYLGQRLDERTRLVGICCIVLASAFASAIANHWLPATGPRNWQHRLADLVNRFYVDGFFSWYLWRLVTRFPKAHDLPLTRRILWLGTQVSLAGALVLEVRAAFLVYIDPNSRFPDGATRARDEITLLWFLALGAFVVLAVRIGRATSFERRRIRFVAAGFAALFLVLCLVLNSLVSDATQQETRVLLLIGFALLLVFTLLTVYTWVAHGALDARLAIQRLVTFRLFQLLIGATSFAPLAVFIYLLDKTLNSPLDQPAAQRGIFPMLALALLALLVGGAILRWLSGRYRGAPEDRMRSLEAFSRELRNIRTGKQLHAALADLGQKGFGTQGVHVLLAPSFPGRHPDLEKLAHNSLLPGLFELRDTPLLRENQDPYEPEARLTQTDRQLLDSFGASVVAPIRSAEGFVLAVLAVSQKNNQMPYTPTEVEAIGQAALLSSFKLAQWYLDQSEALGHADAASRCVICDKVAAADIMTCPACDGPTAKADIPWKLEDRFLFEQRLGQGAFGSVYSARDLRLHRQVAIKVLKGQRGSELAISKEAGAMAQLEHPHIAAIFGLEKWSGQRLMVTELLEGGTLEQRLQRGPLEEAEAIYLVQNMAMALRSAHDRGFLHGDIKPSNIGFTGGGRCKLIDLGLTSLMSETPTEFMNVGSDPNPQETCQLPGGGMGTPLYASPEMWASLPAEKTDDLWGLVVVLFEASTGAPPFRGANAEQIRERVLAGELSELISRSAMTPQLARFIRRGLAPEPASRFVDAEELLRELHKTWPSLDQRRL